MISDTKSAEYVAPHFDGKRFYNPGAPQARGLKDVWRWKRTSRAETSPKFIDDVTVSTPAAHAEDGKVRTTLINHSTLLLQMPNSNLLTDPIWSERASPVQWLGPRRHRKPGVRMEDLPRIDAVLLTHNHYDHLDMATLRKLRRLGEQMFVAPLGVARFLRRKGFKPVQEVDWGDAVTVGEAVVYCVPALHFSARGAFDRNKSLWCGYVIEAEGRVVYLAGDTGFGDHFAQIRERFGAPDLAFLPIGAYEPRWFMAPVHMAPEEAIRAHEILGAQRSVAIHHGTFQLSDEGIEQPALQLTRANCPENFVVLKNGESVDLRDR